MPDEDNPRRPEVAFVERRRWPRVSQEPIGTEEKSGAPLGVLRFETSTVDLDQQFPAWQKHVSSLVTARLPENVSSDEGFAARQTVWNLRGMLLVQQTVPAFSYERTVDMVRFSPIDHWQFTFLRTGRTWTGVDGRIAQNEPGMMEIRCLGQPFNGRALETDAVMLIVPDDRFSDHGAMPLASNNTILGGRRVKFLYEQIVGLEASLDSIVQADLPSIKSRLLGMLLDTVTPLVDRDGDSERVSQLGMMTRARRLIRNRLLSTDLTPESLSRELAISRTRLYELFEQVGGVAKYVRQQRLSAAHGMIGNPADRRTIAEVGAAIGYDSAANFSRAFSQQFGYSPSNVRAHRAETDGGSDGDTIVSAEPTFERLLQTLGSIE